MTKFHQKHRPVLLEEAMENIAPIHGENVLDLTLGLGGHSGAFLERIGSKGRLTGMDADVENLEAAKSHLSEYQDQTTYIHSNFLEIPNLHLETYDVIFADLGLSSPHLDDPEKGFSFREDGPLDMRFDRTSGLTAAQYISQATEEDLANTFYYYGEIRQSRKLAAAIKADFPKTTAELSNTCTHVFGFKTASMLPQVFQSLRIAVNRELEALNTLLNTAPTMLRSGGRLGVISFHSLEDRAVKQTFKKLSTPEIDDLTGAISKEAQYELVTKKAVKPSAEEIEQNPRARSAVLRVLRKR